MRSYFTGLWRHTDFLKLWIGQGILGTTIGLRPTLVAGTGGMLLVVVALLVSSVRALHAQPAVAENGPPGVVLPRYGCVSRL